MRPASVSVMRLARPWSLPLLALALALPMSPAAAAPLPPEGTGATIVEAPNPETPSPETPTWFLDHIAFITQDTGRWLADNAAYRSDREPFDTYGTEWRQGPGGKSLSGRLFALRDGQEVATFWEFRAYWHPGEQRVVMLQFGADGTVGVGSLEDRGEHRTRSEQTFFRTDGTRNRVGHDATDRRLTSEGATGEDATSEHVTDSFDIAPDGTWKPSRSYTWKLQP